MIAAVVVAVLGIGITAWAVATNGGSSPAGDPRAAKVSVSGVASPGSRTPDFTAPQLDGGEFTLSSTRGRPVVVNFWASWCVPCRKEFPAFRRAYRAHRAQELEIVGVDHDDITSDGRDFARRQRAGWTLVSDDVDGSIGTAYGVRAMPQTVFVDRAGRIVSRLYGQLSDAALRRELAKIL